MKLSRKLKSISAKIFPALNNHAVKNNYSKLCVIDYYEALNIDRNDKEVLDRLHKAFSKHKVRSILVSEEWWSKFLKATRCFNDELEDYELFLTKDIELHFSKELHHWEILHMYILSLKCGLFNIGVSLRNLALSHALSSVRKEKDLRKPLNRDTITALLESNKEALVYECINNNTKIDGIDVSLLKFYLSLIDKNIPVQTIYRDSSDDQFRKFIEGKSVAIVGPAKTSVESGQAIDNHDIVLRMNYRIKGSGVDSKIKGLKCDISNFSVPQIKSYINENNSNWPDSIKWVCVNNEKIKQMFEAYLIEIYSKDDNLKHFPNFRCRIELTNDLLFNMNFTQLPKIILDILNYKPSKITIYHSDLMLTVDRMNEYVPKNWGWDNNEYKTFLDFCTGANDPVPQLYFLKKLYNANLISGDTKFKEVMTLSESEYMAQLQNIYGNAGRITFN